MTEKTDKLYKFLAAVVEAEGDAPSVSAVAESAFRQAARDARQALEASRRLLAGRTKAAPAWDPAAAEQAEARVGGLIERGLETAGRETRPEAAAGAGRLEALRRRYERELDIHRRTVREKEALDRDYRRGRAEAAQEMLEREQRLAASRVQLAKGAAGELGEIFEGLSRLSGGQQKEYLRLAKAAATAEAVMNTAVAVTKAWREGGPYAGPALAALAAARGYVQVALIQSQELAAGGLVNGWSPHDRADNIPALLTAGEYVLPVAAQEYYGPDVLEALRRRKIPSLLLRLAADVQSRQPPSPAAGGLADGGPVMDPAVRRGPDSSPAASAAPQNETGLTIVNVTDRREVLEAMSSLDGERTVVNIIARNAPRLRRLLGE